MSSQTWLDAKLAQNFCAALAKKFCASQNWLKYFEQSLLFGFTVYREFLKKFQSNLFIIQNLKFDYFKMTFAA